MNDMTDRQRCTRGCIYLGAAVGAAIFLMLWLIGDWGWLLALAGGAVLGGVAIFLFSYILCGKIETPAPEEMTPRPVGKDIDESVAAVSAGSTAVKAAEIAGDKKTSSSDGTEKAAEAEADVSSASADPSGKAEKAASGGASASGSASDGPNASAPVGGAASEPTAGPAADPDAGATFSGIKPSKPLKGQQELAERKGSYKYEAPADDAPAEDAQKAEDAKTADRAPAEGTAAPGGFPDVPDDTPESKPETLDTARGEGADNLKLISGVGPKLEQTLNELGFYHFDQIAKWGPQEIAWVDARLRFKGRIARDDWMAQAKTLAEGGETEFSARKKKT